VARGSEESERVTKAEGTTLRHRLLTSGFILAAGLVAAFVSWKLQDDEPWWSAILGNLAVTVVLLIPAEFALSWVRRGFRSLQRENAKVRKVAEDAHDIAARVEGTLEEVQQALVDRQTDEYSEYVDVFRKMARDSSRDSLIHGLRLATRDGIVTEDGVRSPIWATPLHYRYLVDQGNEELVVRIERDNADVISTHIWGAELSPLDFYQELAGGVHAAGHDLGVGLNLPTESVLKLSEMLVDVSLLRSQVLMGHRDVLRGIIERRDGWYFTEKYVVPEHNLSYAIEIHRLNESDWEEHLRGKGWLDAADAIRFARRLYSSASPQDHPTDGDGPTHPPR